MKNGDPRLLTIRSMSLLALRDRLNEIIADNEKLNKRLGGVDRNNLPVIVRVMTKTPTGKLGKNNYFPLTYACSGTLGLAASDEPGGPRATFVELTSCAEKAVNS